MAHSSRPRMISYQRCQHKEHRVSQRLLTRAKQWWFPVQRRCCFSMRFREAAQRSSTHSFKQVSEIRGTTWGSCVKSVAPVVCQDVQAMISAPWSSKQFRSQHLFFCPPTGLASSDDREGVNGRPNALHLAAKLLQVGRSGGEGCTIQGQVVLALTAEIQSCLFVV
jgi:hypothetical protein